MTDTPADDDPNTIWVRSDTMPDGSYGIGFNIGADHAWTLTAGAARRHALACFAAATVAEHDAAVVSLLRDIGLDPEGIALTLHDIRVRRGTDPVAWPSQELRWEPRVTIQGKPFLATIVRGEHTGQCNPAAVRDHGAGVLAALTAVRLDTDVRQALVHTVGVDEGRARAFVHTLQDHWPR